MQSEVPHLRDLDGAARAQVLAQDRDEAPTVRQQLSVLLDESVEVRRERLVFLGVVPVLLPRGEGGVPRQEPGLARARDRRHGDVIGRPVRPRERRREALLDLRMRGSLPGLDLLAKDLEDLRGPGRHRALGGAQRDRDEGQQERAGEGDLLHRSPPPSGAFRFTLFGSVAAGAYTYSPRILMRTRLSRRPSHSP